MRDVEQLSGEEMKLGPGTLYRCIQRMVVDGLIEERDLALDGETDDDRRRYYRLTAREKCNAAKYGFFGWMIGHAPLWLLWHAEQPWPVLP